MEILSRLRSPYLLALLGYCSDNNHKVLVYEFMANGGLQEHLYPISGKQYSLRSLMLLCGQMQTGENGTFFTFSRIDLLYHTRS